jgi:membrane glycosyltransferase
MAEFVTLLGTLAIIMTFVGTYQFSKFFFTSGSPLSILIALSLTVAFMIMFEYIILAFGILALLSPFLLLFYWTDRDLSPDGFDGFSSSESAKTNNSTTNTGNECPYCGEENDPANNYCTTCRRAIDD